MSYDLCLLEKASKPYYIENIRTGIYSLEELCFYLYHNMYLIDDSIMNEKLCDWLRDELKLARLYRQLYDHLEKNDGAVFFVLPIFREAGYLTSAEIHEYQEKLSRLEVQSEDMRQKLRADYLVKEKMYAKAVSEYQQIQQRKSPGNLGTQFYASIWNNLGCAYAGLFQFEQAAECFLESYRMMKTKETLRKYISTLPLFLKDEEYQKKLDEIEADKELVRSIQKYNAEICQSAEKLDERRKLQKQTAVELIQELKEQYYKSTKV